MSKPVKNMMAREYEEAYSGIDDACLVSVIGLDAISTNKLRGELRARKMRLRVVKNSLARRALARGALSPLGHVLEGPCALVTGGESVIDAAKALVELKKNYPKLELKVGILAGDPVLIPVDRLATMKNRKELLGELSLLFAGPGRRLASCLAGPAGRIAGCVKAIVERASESGGAAEPSDN